MERREARQSYTSLRKMRKEAGVTQEEMARMLGFASRNAYSMKECGRRRFSVEEAVTIARELGSDVETLFPMEV